MLSLHTLSFVFALLVATPQDQELDAELNQRMIEFLAADEEDVGGLFDECVRIHGGLEPLLAELETFEVSEREFAARKARAKLLMRYGDLEEALATVELVREVEDEPEWRLRKARILDALGREKEALDTYSEVLDDLSDEEQQVSVRLRMALLSLDQEGQAQEGVDAQDALVAFAREEGRDVDMRNRAAIVLSLLGRYDDAIELFVVRGEGAALFRQQVRVAEWALRAENAGMAKEFAWRAVHSAELSRDRHYALAVLVEAHRSDESLGELIDKFGVRDQLDEAERSVWIGLLRETGRFEEALSLFQSGDAELTIEMRRELLEMYREAGREEGMVAAYQALIVEEPEILEWRAGLSRYFLERGDRQSAIELWRAFLDDASLAPHRLEGMESMMALGLDELAIECAEAAIAEDPEPYGAMLFLFRLRRSRGQLEEAALALERMDRVAPEGAAARMELAESYEQLGQLDRAVDVLQGIYDARGPADSGEDLEMRLAWLYSEVGDEEEALARWRELWERVESIPRRRYVEDRMMTVASRLGTLADIAVELEEKLAQQRADKRDSNLLVRLYSKISDPVSAAEVIEEYLKFSGGSEVEALQEKARVYLSCLDYYNYEKTVRRLVEVDPEGEGDYLRQLAMSQLERGRPDEAREVLQSLKEKELGSDSAEFEAGVLAISGMRAEAIQAYRRGIAEHPNRIESYLLMANLMRDTGQLDRAIGTFQYLAENADQDDLFTIAVDGLLNMVSTDRPPPQLKPVMRWARRVTLERLARRHDKMYLYNLISDVADAIDEKESMLIALEGSLPIAGIRRPSVLRELMDLAKGQSDPFGRGEKGDTERHLAYGRRLIGLEELVPPQVYLDLGEAFLDADEVDNAVKTFRLASDLPDYDVFQRQVASLFERKGHTEEALEAYEQVLVAQSGDIGLMTKVGELQEQLGRDDVAGEIYTRALGLLMKRLPLSQTKAEEKKKADDPFSWWGARNVDEFDQYFSRLQKGFLVTVPDRDAVAQMMDRELAVLEADLAGSTALESEGLEEGEERVRELRRFPRILRRADALRRLAVAFQRMDWANEMDLRLLAAFPEDEDLLQDLCAERARWGLVSSMRSLIDQCERDEEQKRKARFLGGEGVDLEALQLLPLDEVVGSILPLLVQDSREEAKSLLRRVDYAAVESDGVSRVNGLFNAALFLGDQDLILSVSRQWMRLSIKHGRPSYEVEGWLERCVTALEPGRRRSLASHFVSSVLDDVEKGAPFVSVLPNLQKHFEEPLVTEEEVLEIVDEGGDRVWGFAPVLQLLAPAERAAATRAIWPNVQKTFRAQFLLGLVSDFEEPLGDELGEFIVDALPEAIDDADRLYPYMIERIGQTKHNVEIALRVAGVLAEKNPDDWSVGTIEATMLAKLERDEEALTKALEVFASMRSGTENWDVRRNLTLLFEHFLPEHYDAFEAELDRVDEEFGTSVETAMMRIQLVRERKDPAAELEVLLAASEAYPEDEGILQDLRRYYGSQGQTYESMQVLERLGELKPDDANTARQLVSGWKALRYYEKALAAQERADANDASSNQNVIHLSGGVVVYVAGPVETSEKPTIEDVKKHLDDGEPEEARRAFRGLWRDFVTDGGRSFIIFGWDPVANLTWPVEPKEPEYRKGGLLSFDFEEPEPEPDPPSAYEVLAQHEFGVDEMQRLLRTKEPGQLNLLQPVFDGLLDARIAAADENVVLAELLDEIEQGRAGKPEYAFLLGLLDAHPDVQDPEVERVLGDLVRTMNPLDVGQQRRLARVYARTGQATEATRMYRWCATQANPGIYFFGETETVSAQELVKEVKEHLEGENREAIVQAILDFAQPPERSYWMRDQYEVLALRTWTDMVGPVAALEKCRPICEGVTDLSKSLRRESAQRAAFLWARAGEMERAIECLEIGICKLDPSEVGGEAAIFGSWEYPGHLDDEELRLMFVEDLDGWEGAAQWCEAVASAVLRWQGEDRMNSHTTLRTLVLCVRGLHELGRDERALELLEGAKELPELTSHNWLWIADATRLLGDDSGADAIERRLFDEERLSVERIPDLIRRVAGDDLELARELGERATAYTRHPELLELLAELDERAEDAAGAQAWREMAQVDAAAKDTLADKEREAAAGA